MSSHSGSGEAQPPNDSNSYTACQNASNFVVAVVQLVEYRTRNQEVVGSTHTRSTASNLEQVANLCALPTQPPTLSGTGNQ